MAIKNLFTKRRISDFFILLMGIYTAWIQIDCFYHQTLTNAQQKAMSISTIFLILMGTFYLMPKIKVVKDFFTRDILGGVFSILVGIYLIWIPIDCFYEETMDIQQIKSMGIIGFLTVLLGYYYIMKEPKTT